MVRSTVINAAAEGFVELGELTDEQIKPAIIVIVEPTCASAPSGSRNAGLLSYVCKRPIAIIAVENVATELGNVQVGKAIAVVVTNGYSHSIATPRNSCFLSDVCKCAVAIIAIESIA